ncbi:hypothetical protein GQ54DRAFT_335453 [Martensiomyces pterosporus]|nr:hypothetical protein GQ54DRAFT_335453 [Martensiomyces pterosporus]
MAMASSVAVRHSARDGVQQGSSAGADPPGIHTGRAFDALSPQERDTFLGDIELGFRRWIAETRSTAGFVFYPSTRQITKAITSLYQTLAEAFVSSAALIMWFGLTPKEKENIGAAALLGITLDPVSHMGMSAIIVFRMYLKHLAVTLAEDDMKQ